MKPLKRLEERLVFGFYAKFPPHCNWFINLDSIKFVKKAEKSDSDNGARLSQWSGNWNRVSAFCSWHSVPEIYSSPMVTTNIGDIDCCWMCGLFCSSVYTCVNVYFAVHIVFNM